MLIIKPKTILVVISVILCCRTLLVVEFDGVPKFADATTVVGTIDSFQARPPIHAFMGASSMPLGLSPSEVKAAYGLPATGGSGTIAIVSAFHHSSIEGDLAMFDKAFSLAVCTIKNGCLEIHTMSMSIRTDAGWDMETALDTEWSHAVAPKAKVLVIEAASDAGPDLLKAVDYATSRKDVISVSMSWGGGEFAGESTSHARICHTSRSH